MEEFQRRLDALGDTKPITNREKAAFRKELKPNQNPNDLIQRLLEERSMTNVERKQKSLEPASVEAATVAVVTTTSAVTTTTTTTTSNIPPTTGSRSRSRRQPSTDASVGVVEISTGVADPVEIKLTNADKKRLREAKLHDEMRRVNIDKELGEKESRVRIIESGIENRIQRMNDLDSEIRQRRDQNASLRREQEGLDSVRDLACIQQQISAARGQYQETIDHQQRSANIAKAQLQLEINEMKNTLQRLQTSHDNIVAVTGSSSSTSVASTTQQVQIEASNVTVLNYECKICFTERQDLCVLTPCGHHGFCSDCVACIQQTSSTPGGRCPVCRRRIETSVRLYG